MLVVGVADCIDSAPAPPLTTLTRRGWRHSKYPHFSRHYRGIRKPLHINNFKRSQHQNAELIPGYLAASIGIGKGSKEFIEGVTPRCKGSLSIESLLKQIQCIFSISSGSGMCQLRQL
jgi:hypothetical protein